MGNCESCNGNDDKYQEIVRKEENVIFETDPFVPYQQEAEKQEMPKETPIYANQQVFEEDKVKDQQEYYDSSQRKLEKTDDKVVIQLADGSTYEGKVDGEGRPDGYGKQTWDNGDEYIGNFKAGSRSGIGKLMRVGRFNYHGDFKDNKISGYGAMTIEDGRIYKGNFMNGFFHGTGELIEKDGSTKIGQFNRGNYIRN